MSKQENSRETFWATIIGVVVTFFFFTFLSTYYHSVTYSFSTIDHSNYSRKA